MPLDRASEVRRESQDSNIADRGIVKVWLDQDYDTFTSRGMVLEFIFDLANALKIPDAAISLLAIRSGCVILILQLPDDVAQRLLAQGILPIDPGLRRLFLENQVRRISAGDMPEAPYFNRPVGFDANLCWLHLSDLHITADYTDPASETRADLTRLLEDLPRCLGEMNIEPDAIFFTGDIAQKGEDTEYVAAEEFFRALRGALPRSCRNAPFAIIPGNHDVQWSEINSNEEWRMRGEAIELAEEAFLDNNLKYASARQKAYSQFARRINGDRVNWCFDGLAYSLEIQAPFRGVDVGVAGLNSSWLSTRKDLLEKENVSFPSSPDIDLQNLRLGGRQLRMVRNVFTCPTVRIALMHHEPLSLWFAESDREIQRQELTYYDFVLRGHQHEAESNRRPSVGGHEDFIEIAPAALRTQPSSYEGFIVTQLDFGRQLFRVISWAVSNKAKRWILDPEFGSHGIDVRPMPRSIRDRLGEVAK